MVCKKHSKHFAEQFINSCGFVLGDMVIFHIVILLACEIADTRIIVHGGWGKERDSLYLS